MVKEERRRNTRTKKMRQTTSGTGREERTKTGGRRGRKRAETRKEKLNEMLVAPTRGGEKVRRRVRRVIERREWWHVWLRRSDSWMFVSDVDLIRILNFHSDNLQFHTLSAVRAHACVWDNRPTDSALHQKDATATCPLRAAMLLLPRSYFTFLLTILTLQIQISYTEESASVRPLPFHFGSKLPSDSKRCVRFKLYFHLKKKKSIVIVIVIIIYVL